MPRTFLALPLPERVRKRLSEESDRLRLSGAHVTWVRPTNYHVTVRFLGDVEFDDLQVIDPVVRNAADGVGKLRLVVKGLGAFPEEGEPRVVWCGLDAAESVDLELLHDLKKDLDDELSAHGYRREKAAYRPHVTLGRVRSPRNIESLRERLGPAVRREFGHFTASEIVLYESTRSRDGMLYTPLQRFPLA